MSHMALHERVAREMDEDPAWGPPSPDDPLDRALARIQEHTRRYALYLRGLQADDAEAYALEAAILTSTQSYSGHSAVVANDRALRAQARWRERKAQDDERKRQKAARSLHPPRWYQREVGEAQARKRAADRQLALFDDDTSTPGGA